MMFALILAAAVEAVLIAATVASPGGGDHDGGAS